MYKIKQLYIIIFLSFCFLLNAQSLKFDNYTSKDGLISDEVYKIFQDKKGYIWMFTNYGAMKYNGKKFVQVLKNLPFNESFIYSYYENDQGQKWIANSNCKIYEIKNDSAFLVKGTEKISEIIRINGSEILEIVIDKMYNIYITTKKGSYKLIKNKNFEAINLNEIYKFDSTFVYIYDIDGEIISSVNEKFQAKLYITKNRFFNIKYINQGVNCLDIIKFYSKKSLYYPLYFKHFENNIYFLLYDYILKIKKDKSIKYIPIHSFILNYTKDKKGHLWVATFKNGLYELDTNDSIINHFFIDKTINHVLIDSENGLWISTDGSGVFHCKDMNQTHFNEKELSGNIVNFIKKIDDKIFLINDNDDITVVENAKTISVKSNINNEVRDILDIIKFKSGYIICYRYHLEYLEINPKITRTILPIINLRFYPLKLFNIGRDTILYLGRNSILVLKNGIKKLQDTIGNKVIIVDHKFFDFEFRGNDKLFATDDGVYLLNSNNKFTQPNYLLLTKKCKISKITKDVYNNLWFCTKGSGLFKLTNKNELIHFTVENGLPSNIINDISFNTNHSILLSTNIGLFLSSKFKKWIEVYPEQVKSAFEFKNNIYFTTRDGLIIQKDIKLIEEQPIYFNLASVLVNNNPINDKQIGNLAYDQNSLEFNFDIISFSSSIPDIIYQLNAEKVLITQNQQVIFQNLIPGNYTLTASLANHHKSFPIIISFNIIPAFWQTNWFFGLCILLSLFICIYSIWKTFKYYKVKENKKNEANRLITEYKLIALKAQINPHFMSNCLTAIQHLIISGKVDEANQYLAKFSLLVRQVLNFSSKALVTLKEELEITQLNIELEQLRFENRFLFEIVFDEKLDLSAIFVPPLILQPIIENAIWHGLIPLKKTTKAKLIIEIYIKEDTIFISIEDNGVGRKKTENNIGNLKESKGIDITKQRIFNLNDYYNTNKADLIYEDLFDGNNNAIGTRVIIVLPLNLFQTEE